ncbi:5'-nucleotidase [Spironucleus salmonicida]|uniref:5'-nucleotidase n=1 Tax=Spironucleus salmonicida TaxID=348837 RepID=V6LJ65_9EUKA|nr:5'-nucleotidase [Spironucleus salmonicida]|eukprot:EST43721.1 5'-nucleotidase [Spironucleus salmonicida]
MPLQQCILNQYRQSHERLFVNKPVDFTRIKAVGFDMDYTIINYTEAYEELQYSLTVKNLITKFNYPSRIQEIIYDKLFGVKGLFLDTQLGNILKVDQFGYVQKVLHGKTKLNPQQFKQIYQDGTIPVYELENSSRFYLQSTAFAAPLITLYAELIEYFENLQSISDPLNNSIKVKLSYNNTQNIPKNQLCYQNLFEDINQAMGMIHGPKDALKQLTQISPSLYVIKDDQMKSMLRNMRKSGKIVFLATNSGYEYTHTLLTYAIGQDYKEYFDYLIVDANKPDFFTKNIPFREVDDQGVKLLKQVTQLKKNKIYAMGNMNQFCLQLGYRKKDILYVGDHIIGDVNVSRNEQSRTLFICPEILQEIKIMQENKGLYEQLGELEKQRAQIQAECCKDHKIVERPTSLIDVQNIIEQLNIKIDEKYNKYFGSAFTTSWGFTWLASIMKDASDMYTWNCVNLIHYPPYYRFTVTMGRQLPHQDLFDKEIVKECVNNQISGIVSNVSYDQIILPDTQSANSDFCF